MMAAVILVLVPPAGKVNIYMALNFLRLERTALLLANIISHASILSITLPSFRYSNLIKVQNVYSVD